jgi:hypothetical protein
VESPREVHESKAVRWVGHLSEEELLGGPPAAASRARALSFEPQPLPAPSSSPLPPPPSIDPLAEERGWPFEARDLITVGAVAAAVWFALQGSEGLPFRSSEAVVPSSATELVTTNVALDRRELGSLPRGTSVANASRGSGSGLKESEGGRDNPKPPPEHTSTPPLAQVTVPSVGTVTVEQPDLPGETPLVPRLNGPTLPGAGDLLPQTPTVSLPLP